MSGTNSESAYRIDTGTRVIFEQMKTNARSFFIKPAGVFVFITCKKAHHQESITGEITSAFDPQYKVVFRYLKEDKVGVG